MKQLTRRETLELCVLSLLAVSTGCADKAGLSDAHKGSMGRYSKQLEHIKSCRIIGRDWLDEQSSPFDIQGAYQQLVSATDRSLDVQTLQAKLHQNRRLDFETGKIINRKGWLLSETELTLFALLSVL